MFRYNRVPFIPGIAWNSCWLGKRGCTWLVLCKATPDSAFVIRDDKQDIAAATTLGRGRRGATQPAP